MGYAPVLFPGYSFGNNGHDMSLFNLIPRKQGQFFTHQFNQILQLNTSWIYLAMFDEINEGKTNTIYLYNQKINLGTAFYKIASQKTDTPSNANVTYEDIDGGDVSPDAYLKLASELTQKFHK